VSPRVAENQEARIVVSIASRLKEGFHHLFAQKIGCSPTVVSSLSRGQSRNGWFHEFVLSLEVATAKDVIAWAIVKSVVPVAITPSPSTSNDSGIRLLAPCTSLIAGLTVRMILHCK